MSKISENPSSVKSSDFVGPPDFFDRWFLTCSLLSVCDFPPRRCFFFSPDASDRCSRLASADQLAVL